MTPSQKKLKKSISTWVNESKENPPKISVVNSAIQGVTKVVRFMDNNGQTFHNEIAADRSNLVTDLKDGFASILNDDEERYQPILINNISHQLVSKDIYKARAIARILKS